MRRVVLATHNAKKAGEMATILGRALPGWSFVSLSEYPGVPEPDETAADYEGNAVIKAESACAHTGAWCVADDAGLEIDALPGELGVHSKRFGGAELPFEAKMARILAALEDVPEERRGARFVCWVALARPGFATETFSATCEGRIARSMSGSGGFGYDPIFWLPERGCTMADLSADEKHAISHRGKVLGQLVSRLSELA